MRDKVHLRVELVRNVLGGGRTTALNQMEVRVLLSLRQICSGVNLVDFLNMEVFYQIE